MKLAELGWNHRVSGAATLQTVTPASLAVSPGHRRMAPPQLSTSSPRFVAYHSASFL
jgi:hypothetical protein